LFNQFDNETKKQIFRLLNIKSDMNETSINGVMKATTSGIKAVEGNSNGDSKVPHMIVKGESGDLNVGANPLMKKVIMANETSCDIKDNHKSVKEKVDLCNQMQQSLYFLLYAKSKQLEHGDCTLADFLLLKRLFLDVSKVNQNFLEFRTLLIKHEMLIQN
jgi:hypothetical protein